jgi:hypothetical protein
MSKGMLKANQLLKEGKVSQTEYETLLVADQQQAKHKTPDSISPAPTLTGLHIRDRMREALHLQTKTQDHQYKQALYLKQMEAREKLLEKNPQLPSNDDIKRYHDL